MKQKNLSRMILNAQGNRCFDCAYPTDSIMKKMIMTGNRFFVVPVCERCVTPRKSFKIRLKDFNFSDKR